MTLEQLRHFVFAARDKNLSQAANALYVSHSAISRSIASLEKELGIRLLNRTSRSVSTTKAGELLLMRASRLLEEVDSIKADIATLGDGEQALLRFSCAVSFSDSMMDFIQSFQAEFPNLSMRFTTTTPFQASEDLSSGRCDLAMTYSYARPTQNPHLARIVLESGHFVFVTSDRSPLAKRTSVSFEELGPLLGIYPPGTPHTSQNLPSLNSRDDALRFENTTESILFPVIMNQDSVVLPEHCTRDLNKHCITIPLTGRSSDVCYDLELYYKEDNPNPMIPVFISALLESGIISQQLSDGR